MAFNLFGNLLGGGPISTTDLGNSGSNWKFSLPPAGYSPVSGYPGGPSLAPNAAALEAEKLRKRKMWVDMFNQMAGQSGGGGGQGSQMPPGGYPMTSPELFDYNMMLKGMM